MSYGLQVYAANGKTVLTVSHQGLLYRETFFVPVANGTTTRSYPEWAGRTGVAVLFDGSALNSFTVSWSYPSGVPTVSVARVNSSLIATQAPAPVYVFIQ